MSKTTAEVINILFNHVRSSALLTDSKKPTGQLSKLRRPEGSRKEDVVIGAVGGLTKEPVQRGILVVNIFVPNLDPTLYPHLNGDPSQPDTSRLLYLSKLFQNVIDETVWEENGDYAFEIQQDDIDEDTNNQHYAWFRIEFYSINI